MVKGWPRLQYTYERADARQIVRCKIAGCSGRNSQRLRDLEPDPIWQTRWFTAGLFSFAASGQKGQRHKKKARNDGGQA
jgi:hypothetical protein